MKRGVGKAMPTQHIVATNGIIRPVGPTDLRDLMGIPRIPVAWERGELSIILVYKR